MSNTIKVNFKHWEYTFDEEELQHGSPSKKQIAKDMLREALEKAELKQEEKNIEFDIAQILCTNEAFPEAALADPIADLKIWNEWMSGVRIFPFSGDYSRLSITKSFSKRQSTTSIGVIGEIMAGIFGQALISPEVLIRPIGTWPDFIFYPWDYKKEYPQYSFLEAKAFTQKLSPTAKNRLGVPIKILGDCLLDAVQHHNFDPFVKIWYSFTAIEQEDCFTVQFLELNTQRDIQNSVQPKTPSQVIDGIAERTIQKAFKILHDNKEICYQPFFRKDAKGRDEAIKKLHQKALEQIESVLSDIKFSEAIKITPPERADIDKSIQKQLEYFVIPATDEDEMPSIPEKHQNNNQDKKKPVKIRDVGTSSLWKYELTTLHREKIFKDWKPNIEEANKTWRTFKGKGKDKDKFYRFWRCGSSVFAIYQQFSF